MRAANEAIVAIATPTGKGGIGIIRISGSDLSLLAAGILSTGKLPPPRFATLSNFIDSSQAVIDQGLALYFQAPASFSGQDVLELHAHGGVAVMRALYSRCLQLGARAANPGEFTLRAHLNGKLDLSQAEALDDLINATSDAAARAAVHSLNGSFSTAALVIKNKITALRADWEARLDFADDEIDGSLPDNADVLSLAEMTRTLIRQAEQGALLGGGLRAAIIGAPNVGKSSIFNWLSAESAAIVTELPGTTRDAITRDISFAGLTIHLSDTAGLRETTERIEAEGVRRAGEIAQNADIIIQVEAVDTDKPLSSPASGGQLIRVKNKIDLSGEKSGLVNGVVHVSAKSGAGMDVLRQQITVAGKQGHTDAPFTARERHLQALRKTLEHIEQATANLSQIELACTSLANAQKAMEVLFGLFDDDDLLGEIFSKFCLGK